MKEKISCIIQHKKPIDVIVFTKGLAALSKMYARRADKKCDTKLLISEVRKGSICVEMIATTVATLFQAVHPIILTINDFRQIYNYLLNPSAYDKPQENIVFADYSNSVDISNISNSEGTITTFKDSQDNNK